MIKKIIFTITLLLGSSLISWAQNDKVTNQYNLLVEEYFSFYGQNKMDSAEIALRKAIELAPEAESNFLLKGNLAELVLARQDTLQAISLLSQALGDQPEMHQLRDRRARLFAEMGRNNEALADFDYIIAKQPNQEVPRYRRVLLMMDMGLLDGAKSDLEIIIKNNEKAYLPRVTLAKVEKKRGDERAAERLLSYLIERYPDMPIAYRERALLYISQDRKAEALKDIRTVIQKSKEVTAEDYQIRGDIWLMYGETAQAKKDYDMAKSLRDLQKQSSDEKKESEQTQIRKS